MRILKNVVADSSYNEQHKLFSTDQKSDEIDRKNPSRSNLLKHIRILDYNISTGFMDEFFRK